MIWVCVEVRGPIKLLPTSMDRTLQHSVSAGLRRPAILAICQWPSSVPPSKHLLDTIKFAQKCILPALTSNILHHDNSIQRNINTGHVTP